MQIWHDDLGIQNDQYETQVLFRFKMASKAQVYGTVSRADCAVASQGESCFAFSAYSEWYRTVRDLMLHGF